MRTVIFALLLAGALAQGGGLNVRRPFHHSPPPN
jgi:hypothetical protein